jgi:hypothetical protein
MYPLRQAVAPLVAFSLLLCYAIFVQPRPVAGAVSAKCELAFNLFDANATNAGSINPGGTGLALAYPGYTNATMVGVDVKAAAPAGCAAIATSNWYVLLSMWHEVLYGKTTDWGVAEPVTAAQYGQIDHVPARTVTRTGAFDYKNDFGPGYATPAAASFDLTAAETHEVTSGDELTVYGDMTRCTNAQGTRQGFAPDYVSRSIDAAPNQTNGIWYWLNNKVTNRFSSYLDSVTGLEQQGGGGKGGCRALTSAGVSDTIVFDGVAPVIRDLRTSAGHYGSETSTVTLDTSAVTELGSRAWLMSFTNSPTCTATRGAWSAWETYATSRTGWNIISDTYGGDGLASDGVRTVCVRVMDRAGNIGFLKGAIALDRANPSLSSFTTANTSTAALSAVSYRLVFSEPVYGLTAVDFSNTGTATGCVFSVAGAEGSTTYDLTVADCALEGESTATLVPRLAALAVYDAAGHTAPATAQTAASLTVDLPAIATTFALQAASDSGASSSDRLTNAASLVYDLVFSESISDLASSDLSNTGTARGCTITPSAATGTTLTVTVSGCGNGTVILTLKPGAVRDAFGTTSPGIAKAAPTVTIDRSNPTLTIRCSSSPTGSYRTCPTSSTAATLYVRVSASDSASSFVADAIVAPAGLGSCSLYSSAIVAGENQQKVYACTTRAVYALNGTVTDRAGNVSSAATAAFTLQ